MFTNVAQLRVGVIGVERAPDEQSALSINAYPCKYILRFRVSVSESELGAEKAVVSKMEDRYR